MTTTRTGDARSATDRPKPGWYSDPTLDRQLRYWDGVRWTEHTQPIVDGTSRTPRGPRTVVDSTVSPRDWSARQRKHVLLIVGVPLVAVAAVAFVLLGGLDAAESEPAVVAQEETVLTTSPSFSEDASSSTTSTSTVAPPLADRPPTSVEDQTGDLSVGVHVVGNDISPGVYRVSLSWARLDADMDVIDNDLALKGVSLMTVLDSDAFVELSGTAVPIEEMPSIDPIGEGLTQGTYLVGADLSPGTYRVVAEPGATAFAARLGPNLEVIEMMQHDTSVVVVVDDGDFALRYTGSIERSS